MAPDLWAGVDVGGRRKGFHVAVIQAQRLVELRNFGDASELATWLHEFNPSLVAVDSPLSPAPDGERSRAGERALVAARICSIRYTPDRSGLASNPKYYEWIEQGFRLYEELGKAELKAIECFPTASWTRWAGPRGNARRSDWTKSSLAARGIAGVGSTLSQDARDAIAAALTAAAHDAGETESFGEIVVPLLGHEHAAPPPFSRYGTGGRVLLGIPAIGDGTSRHGYGVPVFAECGSSCVYCGRDLGGEYANWLNLSIDHVIPTNTIKALDYPREWVADLINLVTACRACNEFLNGYRVTEPPPLDLAGFCDLRDRHFLEKRKRVLARHELERAQYEVWRESQRGS